VLHRIDPFRMRLEPGGQRLVPATVYLSHSLQAESSAIQQLADLTTLDAESIVLATPDIHQGYGAPIGSVFASSSIVSPSAVGYDINCGMRLLSTPLEARAVDVERVADAIRREIPLGEGKSNVREGEKSLRRIVEDGVPALQQAATEEPGMRRGFDEAELLRDLARIENQGALPGRASAMPPRALQRGIDQLGTLGGGNHFIELQRVQRIDDEEVARAWGIFEGQLLVMIHSGSRGLGHEVGGHFMREAKDVCKREGLSMPNGELCWMPAASAEARAFVDAMHGAANFAYANRQVMAQLVRHSMRRLLDPSLQLDTVYDVAHNLVRQERHHHRDYWVHRKGATRAFPAARMRGTPFERTGQPVLIPGSMGTASYLLAGTDTGAESLYSVNHGAGRRLSRTAAAGVVSRKGKVVKQGVITDAAFRESMRGVYLLCEDRLSIKEEAPDAYKDIDAVVQTVAGAGLARVVARMVPLAVLKG
jgi:tRNA-splicing ligase RtcB (3'-phosphate/5'-hydroxy nucleic acid ligase)